MITLIPYCRGASSQPSMDFGKKAGDKRQSILSMSDDEYLVYSEFEFVANNLLSMAALHYSAKSGEDVCTFASKFCSKLESCQHVVGAEYGYICSSRYNRRAFAYSLSKLFDSIPFDEEVTVDDFHQLIELFCPDFPKDLVENAASCVEISTKKGAMPYYLHGNLRIAVFFHIIYGSWIKHVDKFFEDEDTSCVVNGNKLRVHIYELCRSDLRLTIEHPSIATVSSIINDSTATVSMISLEKFKSSVISNKVIAAETCRPPSAAAASLDEYGGRAGPPGEGKAVSAPIKFNHDMFDTSVNSSTAVDPRVSVLVLDTGDNSSVNPK